MSELHPAVAAVRDKAERLRKPEDIYGLATDTRTFSQQKNGKPPAGLLAVDTPMGSVVLAIDLSEFPAAVETVLEEIGLTRPPRKPVANQ